MTFRYIHPSPRLQQFIDYYLVMESSDNESPEPVIVYPAPQAEMVFNYSGKTTEQIGSGDPKESTSLAVSGFFSQRTSYYPHGKLGVVMVGFKPWGVQQFINFQTEEITNTNLDLYSVYPKGTREVEERLMEAESTLDRIQIIESFLLSVIKEKVPDRLIISSVYSIFENKGENKIKQLSKSFHLSEKQFVRRFKSAMGVNPKFFSRLVRFQHILKLLNNGRLDLLGHAIGSGFYDLSHFSHEFTEFTGKTPMTYVKQNPRTNLGRYFDSNIEQSPFYHLIYQ